MVAELGPMRTPCMPYEYTSNYSPTVEEFVVVQAGGCYNRQLRIKQGMRYCSEGEFAPPDALPGVWLPLDAYW